MDLTTIQTREAVMRLQSLMIADKKARGEDVTTTDDVCPVVHHFAPGLYAREMHIKAGVLVIGKTHKYAHLNSVTKGRIAVVSEFGRKEYQAGETFISQPGIKRAGFALEDTIWVTYHPTEETDLEKIEAAIIIPERELIEAITPEVIK